MTADEDQLRALFGDLAGRQPARGTDGAFLAAMRRRRQVCFGALALSVVMLAGVGLAVAVKLPGGSDGSAVVVTEPMTPSPTEPPTTEPEPSVTETPPAPVPPPLVGQTGIQLLVVQRSRLELLDLDAGQRTLLTTDPRLVEADQIDVLAVDGQFLMLANFNTGDGNPPTDVFVTTAGPGSPLRVIGRASYLLASTAPGRAWLVSDNNNGTTTLVEVDLRGAKHRQATLPVWSGARPFANGFLHTTVNPDGSSGTDTELVDAQNRRLHLYTGALQAVSGSTAVLADIDCTRDCEVTVLTADPVIHERKQRLEALPPFSNSMLSPDGLRLFDSRPVDTAGLGPLRLTEVGLTSGRQRRIDDAWAAQYSGPSTRFSPDGRWLLFADADRKSINAHDLTTHRSYRIPGTFGHITQLEPF